MPDHYAIFPRVVSSDNAVMETSSTGPGNVTYTVFYGGAQTPATVAFNGDYYASSGSSSIPNLFGPTAGNTGMVRASSTSLAGAFLRQWSGTTHVGFWVPPSTKSLGTVFRIPCSPNVVQAIVCIGNPGASTVTASLYYGASSTPYVSQSISPQSVKTIRLLEPSKAARVVATGSVFVQLQVEMGSDFDVSFVLPA
jgi:hypothetical protein